MTTLLTWSPTKIKAFRQDLLTWYDANRRDLPWRVDHDPYHVMVSELMLQQTQVNTVIPYYQRFMAAFPTVAALAAAPEPAVLKAWEGLGYYSRARNLHRAAKQLMADYGGQWPTTAAGLRELAGIGPYTAGAIASIAFNQPEPAIDGNAFRVFARLFCIDADITKPATRQLFADLIRQLIDPLRPGDFNQAVMDLGSSYMRAKDPDAAHSPVAAFDESLRTDTVLAYPVKTKKAKPQVVPYFALAIHSPAGWLLEQRPSTGLLANLWLMPLVARAEWVKQPLAEQITLAAAEFSQRAGHTVTLRAAGLPLVRHTFTHRQWQLTILAAETDAFALDFLPAQWVPELSATNLALPTVQKKLTQAIQEGQA